MAPFWWPRVLPRAGDSRVNHLGSKVDVYGFLIFLDCMCITLCARADWLGRRRPAGCLPSSQGCLAGCLAVLCMHACMYVCMCVRVDVCTCGRVYVRACVYAWLHACVRVCAYVCMYVCVYVCMYACTVCVCIYVSIHPSIYLSHPSIHASKHNTDEAPHLHEDFQAHLASLSLSKGHKLMCTLRCSAICIFT